MNRAATAAGRKRVAVIGGGVAGLSAAHQLCKANEDAATTGVQFDITVFDARPYFGGKCATFEDEDKGRSGEHGFRFFPGFYRYVIQTMEEIRSKHDAPLSEKNNVAAHLVPADDTGFYARHSGAPTGAGRSVRALNAAFWPMIVTITAFAIFVEVANWTRWWHLAALGLWAAWAVLRERREVKDSGHDRAFVLEELPDGKRDAECAPIRWSRTRPFRLLALAVFLGIAYVIGATWWLVLLVLAAALFFQLPLIGALIWMWRKLRREIPAEVRPRVFESLWMFIRISEIVTSSGKRMRKDWESQSWWGYVHAWRRSPRFRLTLATGLTRTFVATRAEQMSARTGGAILAQLLYDINPYLTAGPPRRPKPAADRVLDGPTSKVWIEPWISDLRRRGVTFNQNADGVHIGSQGADDSRPGPLVQKLLFDGKLITGFTYATVDDRGATAGVRSEAVARASRETVTGFDDYIVAVSGTGMQQILANSPELRKHDAGRYDKEMKLRPRERTTHTLAPDGLPQLSGVFELDFGWMSGLVFHVDDVPKDFELPRGHLLCLESEWALTALDQSRFWAREHLPGANKTPPDDRRRAIISVNVSDWFNPTRSGLPARYHTLDEVGVEVWAQLLEHIPELDKIRNHRRHVVYDQAIFDPEPRALARLKTAAADSGNGEQRAESGRTDGASVGELENMALVNGEKLLINTSRSWENRPCAVTTVENMFLAGDYVRTYTDFASMESADEAARWATNSLVARHWKRPPPTTADRLLPWRSASTPDVAPMPEPLRVPHELKRLVGVISTIDSAVRRIGLPHPLGVFAAPVGWISGGEYVARRWLDSRFGYDEPVDPS